MEKNLEEILNALFEKVDSPGGLKDKKELERLRSQPKFQRLVEVLSEEGRRSDKEGQRPEVRGQRSEVGGQRSEVRGQRPEVGGQKAEGKSTNSKLETRNSKPIRSLAVVYAEAHKRHYSDQFKMECPDRVEAILTTLRSEGFFGETKTTLLEARKATIEELQSVHSIEYIEFIRNTSKKGTTNLPRSTYLCPGTWDAALYAAGGALMAGELVEDSKSEIRGQRSEVRDRRSEIGGQRSVIGGQRSEIRGQRSEIESPEIQNPKYDAVFVLTRPPGHHATADMYGGFCIFNNSAILAEKFKEKGRVMIINWDIHASNGTKHIFYNDPGVLTLSIHQDPKGIFPKEGFVEEIGRDAGKGYSINIPMPVGSGDEEYLYVFDTVVNPICEQYKPSYIIIECGFDAHHKDPLGGQGLTSTGYYDLGRGLLTLTSSRTPIIFTLEGGYNPNIIGILTHTLLSSLFGMANPKPKKYADETRGKNDKLSYDLVRGLRYDKQRGQKKVKNIQDVIKELKYHLRNYWVIN